MPRLALAQAADGYQARQISEAVLEAVSIRTVSLGFDEIVLDKESGRLRPVDRSMRCRFALRFGDDRGEEEGSETRRDQVRAAFNSPFRPFVLASTSIGQEGLDFHQYCHEIYHWNLPSNPIDLEQREGRHPDRWFWLITERGSSKHVEGIGSWCLIQEFALDNSDCLKSPF
ncbi:hypothetical protein IMZ48_31155 [Candidatus Bathyarchaeota archaeon]|nr:hypothetical protein [Candidatus Bathyarchaeota archaeon]